LLFAIAFLIERAEGRDPAATRFVEESMRTHLLGCIDKKKLTCFPGRPADPSRVGRSKVIVVEIDPRWKKLRTDNSALRLMMNVDE
jgi:hypothetical protein